MCAGPADVLTRGKGRATFQTDEDSAVLDPLFQGGLRTRGNTVEIDLGVRKIWERGKARPFLGGGIAVVIQNLEGLVIEP